MVIFLDGSGVEGQPSKSAAAAIGLTGLGQETESVVDKMVYGAASHGEVQGVADVVGKGGEDVREVWMVVDAETDITSLRRLGSRPLHEALGTGLASQVYAIWHGRQMKKVPLVIHLVRQESHRAGVANDEADGAGQAVDKEQEPEWTVPERKQHLHLVHTPPRVGNEKRARLVTEEDRGRQELRVYPQPVHMPAQVRGGPEVVGLSEYLEGKVGQQVHFPDVLRPETLPKRLQTRRLQAVTGQVPVRETIMRWYRHKGMDLPKEYMRCHCGRGQEKYEHSMRCERNKGIEEPLVRDQDIPLLKKGEKGRGAIERELGKEGHRKGLWHMVIMDIVPLPDRTLYLPPRPSESQRRTQQYARSGLVPFPPVKHLLLYCLCSFPAPWFLPHDPPLRHPLVQHRLHPRVRPGSGFLSARSPHHPFVYTPF